MQVVTLHRDQRWLTTTVFVLFHSFSSLSLLSFPPSPSFLLASGPFNGRKTRNELSHEHREALLWLWGRFIYRESVKPSVAMLRFMVDSVLVALRVSNGIHWRRFKKKKKEEENKSGVIFIIFITRCRFIILPFFLEGKVIFNLWGNIYLLSFLFGGRGKEYFIDIILLGVEILSRGTVEAREWQEDLKLKVTMTCSLDSISPLYSFTRAFARTRTRSILRFFEFLISIIDVSIEWILLKISILFEAFFL